MEYLHTKLSPTAHTFHSWNLNYGCNGLSRFMAIGFIELNFFNEKIVNNINI